MKQFLILCCLGASLWSTGLHAQDSIFEEGAEDEIRAEEISDDLKLWAENTALKLKEVLQEIKKLGHTQKREVLLRIIRESVEEAQGKRELLLMRFMLNRALKLEELFLCQDDALAVNYVLLPGVNRAIFLYENSDLPFLEANKDRPEGEASINPPPYAAFAKSSVGYLLTASNLNKSLRGQFEVVKLSVVWLAKDLLRSTTTRRNPVNARIILKLQKLYEALSRSESPDHALANHARRLLLEVKDAVEGEDISAFNDLLLLEAKNQLVAEEGAVKDDRSFKLKLHKKGNDTKKETVETQTTTTGAVFTRDTTHPALGEAWRDPDGLIWGDIIKRNGQVHFMNVAGANAHCEAGGARLPSIEEFRQLTKYMGYGTTWGYSPQIFPNLSGYWFWSSSGFSSDDDFYLLDGAAGDTDRCASSMAACAVRCVMSTY